MDRQLELLIKKNTLKDVEILILQEIEKIDQELNDIDYEKSKKGE